MGLELGSASYGEMTAGNFAGKSRFEGGMAAAHLATANVVAAPDLFVGAFAPFGTCHRAPPKHKGEGDAGTRETPPSN